MVKIREEKSSDKHVIRTVNKGAFGGTEEANIVDKLRQTCPSAISLVAVSNDQIVGHILFTPVTIQAEETITGMGLGPKIFRLKGGL